MTRVLSSYAAVLLVLLALDMLWLGVLARSYYQQAIAVRPPEDRRRLVAAEIMRAVYSETLARIERRGYDVFTSRVRTPKPLQALIALRQWLFRP